MAPHFYPKPQEDITIRFNTTRPTSLSYDYYLPFIRDLGEKSANVTVEAHNLKPEIMAFDEVTRALWIRNLTKEFVGQHRVVIELIDQYGAASTQEFRFHLEEVPVSELGLPEDQISGILQ